MAFDGYADTMKQFGENIDWTNVDTAITEINKFSADKWEALRNAFPAFSDTIANSHSSLEHMNTFLGINMSQELRFGFTLATPYTYPCWCNTVHKCKGCSVWTEYRS